MYLSCYCHHITPTLNSLAGPRIDALVARRDAIKVWKLLRVDGVASNVRELLVPRSAVSARETRGSEGGDLHLRRCQVTSSQESDKAFSYRGAGGRDRLTEYRALPVGAVAPILGSDGLINWITRQSVTQKSSFTLRQRACGRAELQPTLLEPAHSRSGVTLEQGADCAMSDTARRRGRVWPTWLSCVCTHCPVGKHTSRSGQAGSGRPLISWAEL